MAIKNRAVSIPRAGKIRPGSKKTANAPGRNLDYFRVESDYFTPEVLAQELGEAPKSLRIKFPRIDKNDERRSLEYVFDSSYKAYKTGSLYCKGDGETAMRAVKKGELEQVPCTCELLTGKQPICKQAGDLKVILSALPFMGFFQLNTSSWNSINSIESVLEMYHNLLGEQFWSTEFLLYKEPAILKGHKQYLVRVKIAPEHLSRLPVGSDVVAAMTLEDEDSTIGEVPAFDGEIQYEAPSVPEKEPEVEQDHNVPVEQIDTPPEPSVEPSVPVEVPQENPVQNTAPDSLVPEMELPPADLTPQEEPVKEEVSEKPKPSPIRNAKIAQYKKLLKDFVAIANQHALVLWNNGDKKKEFDPPFDLEYLDSASHFFYPEAGTIDYIPDSAWKDLFQKVKDAQADIESAVKQRMEILDEIPF